MPYAKINAVYLDSAHDAMAIYKYFQNEKLQAYIDLGRIAKPGIMEGFHPDKDFRPICPAGYKMRSEGKWRSEYCKRTSVERSNKSMKVDCLLEHGRHRSSKMWHFQLYCIMMYQHLNAWKKPLGSKIC